MRRLRFILYFGLAAPWVAASVAHAQAATQRLSGYVTLATGYWKHGLAQSDEAALQLGIDYQHRTGLFVGAWAGNVDFAEDYGRPQPRDVEANVYVGFNRRHPTWSWTAALGRYSYPGAANDYAYEVVTGTVGYRDRVFYSASYSDSYYGVLRASLDQEVSVVFPLRGDFEIGAAAGEFRVRSSALDITHWNVGVSKLVQRLALDLRYYDGSYSGLSYFGDPDADHWVLSMSYGLRGDGRRTR